MRLLIALLLLITNVTLADTLIKYEEWQKQLPSDYNIQNVNLIVLALRQQLEDGKSVILFEPTEKQITRDMDSTVLGFTKEPVGKQCSLHDSQLTCAQIDHWNTYYKQIPVTRLLDGSSVFITDFISLLATQYSVSPENFNIFLNTFSMALSTGNIVELPDFGYFSLAPARSNGERWLRFSEEIKLSGNRQGGDLVYIHPLVNESGSGIVIPRYTAVGDCEVNYVTQQFSCITVKSIPGITVTNRKWVHDVNEELTMNWSDCEPGELIFRPDFFCPDHGYYADDWSRTVESHTPYGCGIAKIKLTKRQGIISIKEWALNPDYEGQGRVVIGHYDFNYDYSIKFLQPNRNVECSYGKATCNLFGDPEFMNTAHGAGIVFVPGGGRGKHYSTDHLWFDGEYIDFDGGIEVMVNAAELPAEFHALSIGQSIEYNLDVCGDASVDANIQEIMTSLENNGRNSFESAGVANPNDKDFFKNPIDDTYGLFDYPNIATVMGAFENTPFLNVPAFSYVMANSQEMTVYGDYFVGILYRYMDNLISNGLYRGTRDSPSLMFMKPEDIHEKTIVFGEMNNGLADWLTNEMQSTADLGRYLIALDYYQSKYGQPVTSLDAYTEIFLRWNDATTNKLLQIATAPFVGAEETVRYSMELSGITTDERDIANSLKANKNLTDLQTAIEAFNIASRNQMILTVVPTALVILAPPGEIKIFQRGSGSFLALEQAVTSSATREQVARNAAKEATERLSQLDTVADMGIIETATAARKQLALDKFKEIFFKYVDGSTTAGVLGAREVAQLENLGRFFNKPSYLDEHLTGMLTRIEDAGKDVEIYNTYVTQLAKELTDYAVSNGLLRKITEKISKERAIVTLPKKSYDALTALITADKVKSDSIQGLLDNIITKRTQALTAYADIDYYAAQLGLPSPIADSKNYQNILQWASLFMVREGFNGEMPNLYAHVTRLGFGIPPSIAKIEDVALRTEKYREWIYNQYDYFNKSERLSQTNIENAYIASLMSPEQLNKMANFYDTMKTTPVLTNNDMVIKLFGTFGPNLVGQQTLLRKKITDLAIQRGQCLSELQTMVDSEANTLRVLWDKAEKLRDDYQSIMSGSPTRADVSSLRASHKMAIEEYKHFDKLKKTRKQLVLEGKAAWLGGQIIGSNKALKSINEMLRNRAGTVLEDGNIAGLNPDQLALYNMGLTRFDIVSDLTLPVLKESNRAIAIIGSRTINPLAALETMEMYINPNFFEGTNLVVSGGAQGGDQLAKAILDIYGLPMWTFPARWKEFGNVAGPIRNTTIVENADLILALGWRAHPSPGTSDSIAKALALGKPVYFFDIGTGKGEYLTDPLRHGTRNLKRGVRAMNYDDYFATPSESTIVRPAETILFDSVNTDKKPQYIQFNLPETTLVLDDLSITASSTSGLPVHLSSSVISPVCNYIYGALSLLETGTCKVTATQAGDDEYEAAESVVVTTEVIKRPQLITFIYHPTRQLTTGKISIQDYGVLETIVDSHLVPTFSNSYPTICNYIGGGSIDFIAKGICAVTAYQSGNENYEETQSTYNATVQKREQTITYTYTPGYRPPSSPPLPGNPVVSEFGDLVAQSSSGLSVTITIDTPTICWRYANHPTIQFSKMGDCHIKLSQKGNEIYQPASLENTFAVQ